jgi:hypothetical protein
LKKLLTLRNVFLATAAVFVLWLPLAWVTGQARAGIDVARGRYKVLHDGLGPFDASGMILQERYGIEYQRVADCRVSLSLMAYVSGYNSVSMWAANRRFGHDVFKESQEEGLKRVMDWRRSAR